MTVESTRLGVLLGERSNSFWEGMKLRFESLSPEYGYQVEQFQADIDGHPEIQAALLDRMMDQGFDGIIINPIDGRCLVEGIARAAEKGLPVFDVGGKTDWEVVKDLPNYIPVPTVDFYEQGVLGARFIADLLADRPNWKAAIVEGRPGSAQSSGRSSGAADVLSAGRPDRLIYRTPAYFDRTIAAERTELLLNRWGDLDALFCANDAMALGAMDAVRKTGRDGLIIVGVDLVPEAAEAIAQGSLTASVFFSPADVVRAVLNAVSRHFAGQPQEKGFPVKSRVAHQGNINEFS